MLDTALLYFTGFVAIVFGDEAENYSRQSQQNQVESAVKRKSAAWGIDE